MNDKLNNALNEISDRHIEEAAGAKLKRRPYWIGAVAAILAVAVLAGILWNPGGKLPNVPGTEPSDAGNPVSPQSPSLLNLANMVSAAEYPEMAPMPNYLDYEDYTDFDAAYTLWLQDQKAQYDQPDGYADSLTDYFRKSIAAFLSAEENGACSPVNVYMALAMLAECTGGESRQQILDLLGADSIESLRAQAGFLWNAHYCADGTTTLTLGNSVWLDDGYAFKEALTALLADSYYASAFHGDLGTDEMNRQLQTWLDSQTGGLLTEQANNVELSPDTVFSLASTVYFAAGWDEKFSENATSDAFFHCADKELTTPFMHNSFAGTYYWGDNFGAVRLEMTGSNGMWLILPDEGVTVSEVLESGDYLEMTLNPGAWDRRQQCTINLSLPKFDVVSQRDLCDGLMEMGVTDVFDPTVSDFSPTTDREYLYVSQVNHAARVVIDEEGCVAAAFTVIMIEATGMCPDRVIDFKLDRPFAFVVSSRDNLPLFAGTVVEP